jgi:D-sedoheptulose 7-phosphate isomerase
VNSPRDRGNQGGTVVADYFAASSAALAACVTLADDIQRVGRLMIDTLERDGTIFWCGNGGSASDAEHLAAELVGRFARDREPLRSLALTSNSSITLALGNDYGFDAVFSRQIQGLGRSGDLLIGISTSGKSTNVIRAVEMATTMGIGTVAMTGKEVSPLADASTVTLRAPSGVTSHIQECHIAIGQLLCKLVEDAVVMKHALKTSEKLDA